MKYFVLGDPKESRLEAFLNTVQSIYCDYALKNPFYELGQPILSVQKFCMQVQKTAEEINNKPLK